MQLIGIPDCAELDEISAFSPVERLWRSPSSHSNFYKQVVRPFPTAAEETALPSPSKPTNRADKATIRGPMEMYPPSWSHDGGAPSDIAESFLTLNRIRECSARSEVQAMTQPQRNNMPQQSRGEFSMTGEFRLINPHRSSNDDVET
jgi:hypothetical protein